MIVLSPQEAMSRYLYGTPNPPANKLDPNLINGPILPNVTSVDVNQFMDGGPGRFVTAKDFDYVRDFFNPPLLSGNLSPGVYNNVEVREFFGGTGFIKRYQTALEDGSDDQIERAFVWQTVAFEIQNDARFIVLADGTRYVENLRIKPYSNSGTENFDFVGGIGNLNPFPYDPYGIGKTVTITFGGTRTPATITEATYSTLSTSSDSPAYFDQFYNAHLGGFNQLAQSLFDQGITKFIHDGKAIVYGYRGGGAVDADDRINSFHQAAFNNGIVFVGSNSKDILTGTPDGASVLHGNGGSDILESGKGADVVDGGTGNDRVTFQTSESGVHVDLVTNQGKGGAAEGDTYVSIENVTGTQFDDKIMGNGSVNILEGLGGNDVIVGGDGFDTLRGGAGSDLLLAGGLYDTSGSGGSGAETVAGGAGADYIVLSDASSSSIVLNTGDTTDHLLLTPHMVGKNPGAFGSLELFALTGGAVNL
jgi:Ca2+-binding RTX toxin-like protein